MKFDDRWKERNSKCQHVTPPSSPLKAYSVCVSLLVVHIASLWNQNLNHDVFQTLGSSSVDELPPELREKAQKSNRKAGIENGDCIEKNLLERNLVGSLLPLFPALSDSSRLLAHICTSAQAQNLCKDSKSNCASSAYLHDLRLRIFVSGAHLHICTITGSKSLQRFKIKSSSIHRRDGFLRTTLIFLDLSGYLKRRSFLSKFCSKVAGTVWVACAGNQATNLITEKTFFFHFRSL